MGFFVGVCRSGVLVLILSFRFQFCFMTSSLFRLSCWQIVLIECSFPYCLSISWRRAATVSLLFFASLWDWKNSAFCFRMSLAASSLYGKFGMLSWQETSLSSVSHSLSVSESRLFQFEGHSGLQREEWRVVGVCSITSPQWVHTFSPAVPSGETAVPLHSGHNIC